MTKSKTATGEKVDAFAAASFFQHPADLEGADGIHACDALDGAGACER